ncbi:hypothetical protein H0W80_03540 [Candidatus Saccharibacteria bacterium]|nr:hypothetical protein [Candidatus Saccharibacteria bacterium]
MKRPSLRTITISLLALALPTTLLASSVVAVYFKSTNPNNVDITQGLAYLQQSLFAAIITFGLFAIASVVGIIMMYRRDHNFIEAKLPLVLLCTIIVLMGGVSLANAYSNKVQDQYLIDNGRPTLQQFFDQLNKQDKR